jgi:hypothetical protein
MHTDIHALSGIRTHDHSVRAREDSSCLIPRSAGGQKYLLLKQHIDVCNREVWFPSCSRKIILRHYLNEVQASKYSWHLIWNCLVSIMCRSCCNIATWLEACSHDEFCAAIHNCHLLQWFNWTSCFLTRSGIERSSSISGSLSYIREATDIRLTIPRGHG